MRKILNKTIYALLISSVFSVSFIGCNDNNEPTIDIAPQESFLSQEEYQNKVAGRMWIPISAEWRDKDGNILPPMVDWVGTAGASAIYFLPEGYVYFAISSHLASYTHASYDSQTGWITKNVGKPSGIDIQLISLDNGILTVRTDGGYWLDETNPEAEWDESVWRYYTFKEEENPDMQGWFKDYRPNGFDPSKLGF